MTTFLIDLAIIGIVAFCTWRGFRNGLIRGVFGVVTLIVSLFLANTIARAYSEEFTGMLTPFVGGIIEAAISGPNEGSDEYSIGDIDFSNIDLDDIDLSNIDAGGVDHSNIDVGDIELADIYLNELNLENIDLSNFGGKSEEFLTAYIALRYIALPESSAAHIAQLSAQDNTDRFLSDVIAENISSLLSFTALFGIAFLLLAIVFAVVGNLINFVFALPGFKLADIIAGSSFGFVKGLLIILAIGVVLRYFGLLARDTIEETTILRFIINNNLIANILGV